jgi:murein DD-endopeptidase MepM/ murein hydrolase activator NlpD
VPSRIPGHTRIILIPDDERDHREYSISRAMVILLFALGLLLAGGVALVLLSYAELARQQVQLPAIRAELEEARQRLVQVQLLNDELESMRELQEHLLVMLGVENGAPAGGDTLAGGGAAPPRGEGTTERLERTASLVMTPPPDLWPAAGFVTREFEAGDPARGVRPHEGIDIAGPEGSPVKAAGRGRVVKARWHDYLGNFVEIQHGFEYVTVYGHCSKLAVQEGDRVDRGQLIARLGATGEASAPHLHFEVWKNGVAVDPRLIIAGDPPR